MHQLITIPLHWKYLGSIPVFVDPICLMVGSTCLNQSAGKVRRIESNSINKVNCIGVV